MKDLIKKILREETSYFDPKMLKSLYKFMELQTKDCIWYYDTPEKRFESSPESIWLINPKTKKWVLELKKSGKLLWYWNFCISFQRYFNMGESDFNKFIKIWVEDVLNRRVSTIHWMGFTPNTTVEDVLNRGKELK